MIKKKNSKIIQFPTNLTEGERQIEAILFAAQEPLDIESIRTQIKAKIDILKTLESLQEQYKNRGVNLVCFSNRWSFRTAANLSKLMQKQSSNQKNYQKLQ